jgi:cytochrome c biogenesis factor
LHDEQKFSLISHSAEHRSHIFKFLAAKWSSLVGSLLLALFLALVSNAKSYEQLKQNLSPFSFSVLQLGHIIAKL